MPCRTCCCWWCFAAQQDGGCTSEGDQTSICLLSDTIFLRDQSIITICLNYKITGWDATRRTTPLERLKSNNQPSSQCLFYGLSKLIFWVDCSSVGLCESGQHLLEFVSQVDYYLAWKIGRRFRGRLNFAYSLACLLHRWRGGWWI